jgi:hypothetical protein
MPQIVSIEGLQMYNELKDFGYMWMWGIMLVGAITWIIHQIRESAFQAGYWKGRQAGWDSHRRMSNIKKKSDEVFDYDHNN